jgi:parallel beta-helix repeat protein
MKTNEMEQLLSQLRDGDTLRLEPPRREVQGPIIIRKPTIIDGQGATIWAPDGPVVQIASPNVVLRNLNLEITNRDAPTDGEKSCALVVQPQLTVALDNVAVRGNVLGLEQEEGVWFCPRNVALGALKPDTAHHFVLRLVTPVPCKLISEIDGFVPEQPDLPAGAVTINLRLDALPVGTRLRGNLLLKTAKLTRRIAVTGSVAPNGQRANGTILWKPPPNVDPEAANLVPPEAEVPDVILEPIQGSPLGGTPVTQPMAAPSATTRSAVGSATMRTTLTVSQFDTAQYRTIADALQQAPTGARIVIQPGVYRENLVLQKKVEIVGSGSASEVVIESPDGNCLLMRCDMVRVRNLTLRSTAAENMRQHYAVNAAQGQLILEECILFSDSLAAAAVTGTGTSVELRHCKVQGGPSAGVLALDKGEAILSDCDITGVSLCGVEGKRGGTLTLRHCVITASVQAGALIHDHGKASFEDCTFADSGQAGVEVRGDAQATLRRCKIIKNRGAGVRLHDQGKATLEDCELSENAHANLEVGQACKPEVRRCRLQQGKQVGALFTRDSGGLLEDCDISGNAGAAIEVRQNGNPTFRRCTLRGGGAVTASFRDRGRGLLEECDLSLGDMAVVEVRDRAEPVLKRCKIHDGPRAGVLAVNRGLGTLEECEVFGNQGPGIALAGDSNPVVKGCQVRENGQAGIVVWDAGRGAVERCEVTANGGPGLAVVGNGAPALKNCRVNRNSDAGVWAGREAEGSVENCDLTKNAGGSLDVDPGASMRLDKLRVDE